MLENQLNHPAVDSQLTSPQSSELAFAK